MSKVILLEIRRFCNFVRYVPSDGLYRAWKMYRLVHKLYPYNARKLCIHCDDAPVAKNGCYCQACANELSMDDYDWLEATQ